MYLLLQWINIAFDTVDQSASFDTVDQSASFDTVDQSASFDTVDQSASFGLNTLPAVLNKVPPELMRILASDEK